MNWRLTGAAQKAGGIYGLADLFYSWCFLFLLMRCLNSLSPKNFGSSRSLKGCYASV